MSPSLDAPILALSVAGAERLIAVAADTDAAVLHLGVAGGPTAGARFDLTPHRDLGGGRMEVGNGPGRQAMINDLVRRVRETPAALAPSTGAPDFLRAITDAAVLGPGGTMIVTDRGWGSERRAAPTPAPLNPAMTSRLRRPAPGVTTLEAADGMIVSTLPSSRLGFTEGSAVLLPGRRRVGPCRPPS